MVNTLTLIYTIFYKFGFSIILFTVIVRILMIPLQVRQVKQMKGMAEIQPKIKAIQDKYKDKKDKDNRQKMTSEYEKIAKVRDQEITEQRNSLNENNEKPS